MKNLVFQTLSDKGPITGRELNKILGCPHGHVRLHELVRDGAVENVGTAKCSVTGMHVAAWDVTGRVPVKPKVDKKVGKKKPHIHKITECSSCLLQDENDKEEAVCWMNSSVYCLEQGRPGDCPLDVRDFVVRAG
jgi:hypothetical protein